MDSLERMKAKQVESKEDLFSLSKSNLTDADYAITKEVWNTFKLRTMMANSELYMMSLS